MERKELFRALVGSHNYNLNTEESDKDYKVFVLPTFDDLYHNKTYSKSIIGEEQDLDIHDIRKVSQLWWKSNVNFLEVLFSEEVIINDSLSESTKELLNQLFELKDEIAKMNLPYLYHACMGMCHSKMKDIKKGTSGTQHLVDQYGFDTKQGLHVIRILDFLQRFADNEFNNFKSVVTYQNNDPFKRFLLEIKKGKYSLQEFEECAFDMYEEVKSEYKDKYGNMKPNQETQDKVIEIVKQIVKNELLEEHND